MEISHSLPTSWTRANCCLAMVVIWSFGVCPGDNFNKLPGTEGWRLQLPGPGEQGGVPTWNGFHLCSCYHTLPPNTDPGAPEVGAAVCTRWSGVCSALMELQQIWVCRTVIERALPHLLWECLWTRIKEAFFFLFRWFLSVCKSWLNLSKKQKWFFQKHSVPVPAPLTARFTSRWAHTPINIPFLTFVLGYISEDISIFHTFFTRKGKHLCWLWATGADVISWQEDSCCP